MEDYCLIKKKKQIIILLKVAHQIEDPIIVFCKKAFIFVCLAIPKSEIFIVVSSNALNRSFSNNSKSIINKIFPGFKFLCKISLLCIKTNVQVLHLSEHFENYYEHIFNEIEKLKKKTRILMIIYFKNFNKKKEDWK